VQVFAKMTVITKPITEKKSDKLDEPLVENEQVEDLVSMLLLLNCTDILEDTPVFLVMLRKIKWHRSGMSFTVTT
jgi:hypothetical protein